MSNNIEILRAKLKEAHSKNNREEGQPRTSGGDNASYPFWNIPDGSSALVRFLPDADKDNVFFWKKREVIKLPFHGVVGGEYPTEKQVTVTVPCIDMFGMTCPIIAATRPWWKDEAKVDLARLYYKKKSYIFQGFVVNSPFEEQNVPENPIRRFVINPSIYEIVEKSLMDPEMEDAPTDYTNGCDFRINKTKKGEHANYQTSSWARRSRSLTEEERIAVEQYGLFNLTDYLGRVPDSDEVAAIKAMFEASLRGDPFDMDSYGKYYRPYGAKNDDAEATTAPAKTVSRSTVQENQEDVAEDEVEVKASPSKAHDILEKIKNRSR